MLLVADLVAQEQSSSTIEYISPVPGSSMHMPQTTIAVRTKGNIDPSSLSSSGIITVTGAVSGIHDGKLVLSDDGRTVIFAPAIPFTQGEAVTVNLNAGLRVTDGSGVLPTQFTFMITPKVLPPSLQKMRLEGEGALPAGTHRSSVSRPLAANDSSVHSTLPAFTITTDSTTSAGNIFLSSFAWTQNVTATPYLMILENSGTPYFYQQPVSTPIDFVIQPNGHLTYFDEGPWLFYELDSTYSIVNSYGVGNGYVTDVHELRLLPNGHALLLGDDDEYVDMSKIVANGNTSAKVIGIILQELDKAKNVVFQWRSWDHFKITDATHEDLTAATVDYVHSNAIELDADSNIILSSRHLDEITKIDRSTGNIIWRMGGKNNQFTFVNDTIGYSHQHAIRRIANGDFTMFDNGNFHNPPFSRALEYQVDQVHKIATLVWQYRNNPDYVSGAMGYVQRLPNGNTFIGWGDCNVAVTEVTSNGTKVYEMSLPDQIVSYRAYRLQWNVGGTTSGVVNNAIARTPQTMTLNENYPNPFNPSTIISFSLPATGVATLRVYNILGQRVATLVDGVVRGGVEHSVTFNASSLPSGIYYYRLESAQRSETKKMVLLK